MRKYDSKEAERLKAAPWMLDCLNLNSSYPFWGPGEEGMAGFSGEDGWAQGVRSPTWKNFDLQLDDYNEVVNFHFEIQRDSCPCLGCSSSGYGPEAKLISDSFYYGVGDHPKWCDNITLDEAKYLVSQGRLTTQNEVTGRFEPPQVVDQLFLDEVNGENKAGIFRSGSKNYNHDALNRILLIKARCARLGITLLCDHCDGTGRLFTEGEAHLSLVLWVLHPRKGCSKGIEITRIQQDDLPSVFSFLTKAKTRVLGIFSKIPEVV